MGITPDLIGSLLNLGGKVLDRVIPDPTARAAANLELLKLAQNGELAVLAADTEITKAAADIVKTEAGSSNILTSSWRPILMLVFGGLIVARWFGWSTDGLSEKEALELWSIVKIGLGGYVVGRSVEQTAKTVVPAIVAARK